MFSAGQKIICIDDRFSAVHKALYDALPVAGRAYTVRALYVGRCNLSAKDSGTMEGEIGVLLAEIINGPDPSMAFGIERELGFRAERFQPFGAEPEAERLQECYTFTSTGQLASA